LVKGVGTRERQTSKDAAISGVVDLDDIHRTGGSSNRHTKAEEEAASHELGMVI
jgi:hypothetical protein